MIDNPTMHIMGLYLGITCLLGSLFFLIRDKFANYFSLHFHKQVEKHNKGAVPLSPLVTKIHRTKWFH